MPLIVKVFNNNLFSEQLIGSCYIDLDNLVRHNLIQVNTVVNEEPRWYPLSIENSQHGRVLMGLTLIRNRSVNIPPVINLRSKKYQISLYILGLRGVKSTGLVSVRKPYIEFDFDSLYLYDTRGSKVGNPHSKNVKTEPQESGKSINIKMPVKTILTLP